MMIFRRMYLSQAGQAGSGGGGGGGITQINGNTGNTDGSTTPTITTGTGNAEGTALFTGDNASKLTLTFSTQSVKGNTCLGTSSGSSITTGQILTAFGYQALQSATSAQYCTAVGYQALKNTTTTTSGDTAVGYYALGSAVSSAGGNVAIGSSAFAAYVPTSGTQVGVGGGAFSALTGEATNNGSNTGIGYAVGNNLLTGEYNTLLGWNAGGNYAGAESSNICIGHQVKGTASESHVLRIGNATGTGVGNLNAAYIQGIYGMSPSSPQMVTINSSGQMGSQAIPGGASLSPYIVGPTNSDYTTIQAAINAAHGAGASASAPLNIYIKPGTYNENLTIYDGINLIGMDESAYYGKQGQSIAQKGSVQIVGRITSDLSCSYNKFQNISISGSPAFNLTTSLLSYFEIENCYIEGSTALSAHAGSTSINISILNSYINGDIYNNSTILPLNIYFNGCTITTASTTGFNNSFAAINIYSSNSNWIGYYISNPSTGFNITIYSYSDYADLKCQMNASATITAYFNASYIVGGISTFVNSRPNVTTSAFNCNDGTKWVTSGPTTTSATAGANGDVPAQVVGYLTVNIAGTDYKIPYYNT